MKEASSVMEMTVHAFILVIVEASDREIHPNNQDIVIHI